MVKIVLVSKNASLNEKTVKSIKLAEIYKKCNFKSNDNFAKRHTWKVKQQFYSVYAKDSGRSNSENKYDLPPPIDSPLYFNTMVIVKHSKKTPSDESILDLTKEEWNTVYDTLFGGFEDLDQSEEPSEDDEEYSDSEKTKEGYLKDGFVIDDLEESASYEETNSEEYEEDIGEESEYEEDEETVEVEVGEEEVEEESEEESEEDSDEGYYSELSEESYCSSNDD